MKFLSEYREPEAARRYADAIRERVTRPWTLMEVCGGQTHSIVRFGVDELLPAEVELVHGPGCPVCVTPIERIDQAIEVAGREGVILCTYGDMLRVPGSRGDLRQAKARGADVRVLYSPLAAVELAAANPAREVVFFAVGFETTAPAHALAVLQAQARGLTNFSLIVSHVLVPPAMEAILAAESNRVQGFLAAGHVCTIMGTAEYEPLVARYRVPIVVTGFEPLDLLQGIYLCVCQLEEGRAEVENQYARVVGAEGNRPAQLMLERVFEVVPRRWRGFGEIPRSGLGLRADFAAFDALARFAPASHPEPEPSECIAADVLRGLAKPAACPAFGTRCTPLDPLGAPMVSAEGACAAYYRYRRPQGEVRR